MRLQIRLMGVRRNFSFIRWSRDQISHNIRICGRKGAGEWNLTLISFNKSLARSIFTLHPTIRVDTSEYYRHICIRPRLSVQLLFRHQVRSPVIFSTSTRRGKPPCYTSAALFYIVRLLKYNDTPSVSPTLLCIMFAQTLLAAINWCTNLIHRRFMGKEQRG